MHPDPAAIQYVQQFQAAAARPRVLPAVAKKWKFCDTSVPLDERVSDLVKRISLQEAGSLLTARESAAIPRLGIPAFYWGTNAIHGVHWGHATTFPQAVNMGCALGREN